METNTNQTSQLKYSLTKTHVPSATPSFGKAKIPSPASLKFQLISFGEPHKSSKLVFRVHPEPYLLPEMKNAWSFTQQNALRIRTLDVSISQQQTLNLMEALVFGKWKNTRSFSPNKQRHDLHLMRALQSFGNEKQIVFHLSNDPKEPNSIL